MQRDTQPRDANPPTSRRSFLAAASAGTVGVVAGCVGGGGGDGDEYPSSEIRLIIPAGPGGGFDTYGRGLAEYMPEHLGVEIQVDNVEGAGTRAGAEEAYQSDPDGYTICIFNVPGNAASQLVIDTGYDLNDVSWVGRIGFEQYTYVVSPDSEFETLADLQNADEPIHIAAVGVGATDHLVGLISTEEMGIEREHVLGFDGSQDAITSVIRGETDAMVMVYQAVQSYVEDGELRPIIALDDDPPDFLGDVQTAVDEGYEGLADLGLHYPIGAPPGVDDDQISVLEDALLQTAESDEMAQWSDDTGLPIDTLDSDETGQMIADIFDTFGQYEDLLANEIDQ